VSAPGPDRPTSAEPLRLGVVGCGAVAERYHLPALMGAPDVVVSAFVDPDAQRAQALAARVPGAIAASAVDAVSEHLDAVLLTAPNVVHASVGVPLLERGVHLLVEKPMARTAAECDALIGAASLSGAVLAIGHDFRHFPIARYARSCSRRACSATS
jgi:predicted dehydrogenase